MTSDTSDSPVDEAELLARYLIGMTPAIRVKSLYEKAMLIMNIELDAVDQRLWKIVVDYPFAIRMIDGGLAIIRPHSLIRKKIYTMLAILEASPEHCECFLPQRSGPFYIVNILFSGARAVIAGVLGVVVLKLLGVKAQ